MVFINQSIVLISLPDIFRGIDLNPLTPGNTGYLLWMLMGFMVVLAVLVVTLGPGGRHVRPGQDLQPRLRRLHRPSPSCLAATWLTGTVRRHLADRHAHRPRSRRRHALRQLVGHHHRRLPGRSSAGSGSASTTSPPSAAPSSASSSGGLLAPVEWHLVFLISVPFGVVGTLWAYVKLEERGVRHAGQDRLARQLHLRRRAHPRPRRHHLRPPALRRPHHGLDQPGRAGRDLRRPGHPGRLRDHRDQGGAADVPPRSCSASAPSRRATWPASWPR